MSNEINDLDLVKLAQGIKEFENSQQGTELMQNAIPNESDITTTPSPIEIKDDDYLISLERVENSDDGYDGPGFVITREEIEKDSNPERPPAANDINPDTMDNITNYLKNMEEDFKETEALRAKAEDFNPNFFNPKEETSNPKDEEEMDPVEAEEKLNERYSEAVIMIDKLGLGKIELTPEERDKLEYVKKIKLQEVETVDIKKFKSKKGGKNRLKAILKRKPLVHATPIVLPASGYTATIKGASSYELLSLMNASNDMVIDYEMKWSTIHSKIESTSLGDLTFNDFLKATAHSDYSMLLYGILCATYADDDEIPIECSEKDCKHVFKHKYSVRSLLRAEEISDELFSLVQNAVDSSHSIRDAKIAHSKAPVNRVKTIKLPASGYVVGLKIQSAYDFINDSIGFLSKNSDSKYAQAALMAVAVDSFFINDEESEEYFEFSNIDEIIEIIYNLPSKDVSVIAAEANPMVEENSFNFGLMNVKCPKCGHYRETVPFDIESILFYRYQQEMILIGE